jgi:tetratricopeptide (TPR) repeat protein
MRYFPFFIVFFLAGSLTAQTLLSSEKIESILAGEEALLAADWPAAYAIYEKLHREDTTDPAGYLLRAGLLQAEMTDREENLYGIRFNTLLDSTRFLAKRKLLSCSRRDSALCYLYLGHQYAYRSLWESRFGSGLAALSSGIKAKDAYEDGLKADSTLYDLYFGLGSYHYWKSVKAGFLRTVGLFGDDRVQGIKEIKRAIDSSLVSGRSARAALIWIWINEKDYDSAISLATEMSQQYPSGNTFLWPLGEAYFKSEQYASAAEAYNKILERLKTEPGNYYNVLEAANWLGLSFDKLGLRGKKDSIASYIDSIYQNIPKEIRRKQRSKLGYLQK